MIIVTKDTIETIKNAPHIKSQADKLLGVVNGTMPMPPMAGTKLNKYGSIKSNPGTISVTSLVRKQNNFSFNVPLIFKAWYPWRIINRAFIEIKSQVFNPYKLKRNIDITKLNFIFFTVVMPIFHETRAKAIKTITNGKPK